MSTNESFHQFYDVGFATIEFIKTLQPVDLHLPITVGHLSPVGLNLHVYLTAFFVSFRNINFLRINSREFIGFDNENKKCKTIGVSRTKNGDPVSLQLYPGNH